MGGFPMSKRLSEASSSSAVAVSSPVQESLDYSMSSVGQTEFTAPRTIPFAAPHNITRVYPLKELTKYKGLTIVGLGTHTLYQFEQLCLGTSTRKRISFTDLVQDENVSKENVPVTKSDIVPTENLVSDSGYSGKGGDMTGEAEGYEQAHECTEDAYGKKIQSETKDNSGHLPAEITVKSMSGVSLPTNNTIQVTQIGESKLQHSTPAVNVGHHMITDAKGVSESSTSKASFVGEGSFSLSVESLVSPEYLTQSNKKEEGRVPSHPPHGERSQVYPLSAGKPPPPIGEWEEAIQETPWGNETQGVTIPELPKEELPPMMKPFISLAEQDTMRSPKKYFSNGEVSTSPSLLRFISYPQSEGRMFASDGRQIVTDSAYGSASTTPGT